LRDATLRANIHQLTLRLAMPIDGLFDISQELASIESQLKSRTFGRGGPRRNRGAGRGAEGAPRRHYEYILEKSAKDTGQLSAGSLLRLQRHFCAVRRKTPVRKKRLFRRWGLRHRLQHRAMSV